MAGVVPDEAELCEGQPEEGSDAQHPPRTPDEHHAGEPRPERRHGQRNHDGVVAEAAVEQAGLADLLGEDTKIR